MIKIAIILASTRPGRRGEAVAAWVNQVLQTHPRVLSGEAQTISIDLAEAGLPILDERAPAMFGAYDKSHTRRWSEQIAPLDCFIFVTPEYNHGAPAALTNGVDFLFAEWNDKTAAFVSYGVHGGVRAVEQLRQRMTEVKVANIREQVALSLYDDFVIEDPIQTGMFAPRPHHRETLEAMAEELFQWAKALKTLRAPTAAHSAA